MSISENNLEKQSIPKDADSPFSLKDMIMAQSSSSMTSLPSKQIIALQSAVERVSTMSEKDRALVSQNGVPSPKVHCVPNGVDLERFRPGSRWADPRRVLFIGSFAHLPNVLAVDFLLSEVWPRLTCPTNRIFMPGQTPVGLGVP